MEIYVSYAEWAKGVYSSPYGDNISQDTLPSEKAARAVSIALHREGFGGDGEHFPVRTWEAPESDEQGRTIGDQFEDVVDMEHIFQRLQSLEYAIARDGPDGKQDAIQEIVACVLNGARQVLVESYLKGQKKARANKYLKYQPPQQEEEDTKGE